MKQTDKLNTDRVIRWGLAIGAAVIVVAIAWYGFHATPGVHRQDSVISQKWQFATAGAITGALALGNDGTVYATSADGFVYALDPSANLQWKFEAGPITAAPAIGADGVIYVSNEDPRIFAIDRIGTQRGARGGGPYADKKTGWSAAALDQNYLYTPWRGVVRAIRLVDGGSDWSAGVGFQQSGSISVLPDGLIVYDGVGRLEAADGTGRTQWQYPVMNPPLSVDMILKTKGHIPSGNFWLDSGIAVGFDGTLYAGAADSRLVAFGPEGTYKWEFKTKTHTVN